MLRDFENYCWRDLLTPEMTKITPLIIGPGRSRDVQRSSLFTHPGVQRNEPRMVLAIAHLSAAARAATVPVIHSLRLEEPCDPRR
jgi:hypothetical protein